MKFLMILNALLLLACTTTHAQKEKSLPERAAALASQGKAVIVDVREASEIKDGMVKGALWLPNSKIIENDPSVDTFIASLPKDQTIFVYCASGRRAQGLVSLLKEKGFDAENLGGFRSWVNANLPTMKPVN